jgi:hypothetical protein
MLLDLMFLLSVILFSGAGIIKALQHTYIRKIPRRHREEQVKKKAKLKEAMTLAMMVKSS